MNIFCNKAQANRIGQCCDCHCGPATESSARTTCYDADTIVRMVDAAMIEMQSMHPPMRRSECERLIRAAIGAL